MKNCIYKRVITFILCISIITCNIKVVALASEFDGGSNSSADNEFVSSTFEFTSSMYVNYELKDSFYGKQRWYYFGEDGMMKVGWVIHNGAIYFLQITYNDTFGAMLTGIQDIGGVVYEFSNTGELLRTVG